MINQIKMLIIFVLLLMMMLMMIMMMMVFIQDQFFFSFLLFLLAYLSMLHSWSFDVNKSKTEEELPTSFLIELQYVIKIPILYLFNF